MQRNEAGSAPPPTRGRKPESVPRGGGVRTTRSRRRGTSASPSAPRPARAPGDARGPDAHRPARSSAPPRPSPAPSFRHRAQRHGVAAPLGLEPDRVRRAAVALADDDRPGRFAAGTAVHLSRVLLVHGDVTSPPRRHAPAGVVDSTAGTWLLGVTNMRGCCPRRQRYLKKTTQPVVSFDDSAGDV